MSQQRSKAKAHWTCSAFFEANHSAVALMEVEDKRPHATRQSSESFPEQKGPRDDVRQAPRQH